jgi:hypothetical protein
MYIFNTQFENSTPIFAKKPLPVAVGIFKLLAVGMDPQSALDHRHLNADLGKI